MSTRSWARSVARLVHAARRLGEFAGLLVAIHRERQHLLRLNDRLLRDIGITRFEAEQMARQPIWRLVRERRFPKGSARGGRCRGTEAEALLKELTRSRGRKW